jgi:hypothetical protein
MNNLTIIIKASNMQVHFANREDMYTAILMGHVSWLRETSWVSRFTHRLLARWRCPACKHISQMTTSRKGP